MRVGVSTGVGCEDVAKGTYHRSEGGPQRIVEWSNVDHDTLGLLPNLGLHREPGQVEGWDFRFRPFDDIVVRELRFCYGSADLDPGDTE